MKGNICRTALLAATLTLSAAAAVMAQTDVTRYDERNGLPHNHVTQLLQDELGFMWFATWNGLCRYDGYEFCTFKAQPGDGCHMPTDRFRDIALRPDGCIICRVDDGFYLFDTRTCRFTDLSGADSTQAAADIRRYRMSKARKRDDGSNSFTFTDRQGNLWATCTQGISRQTAGRQTVTRLDIEPKAEVKCLFTDSRRRRWVTTREDAAVRIYSPDGTRLEGYLGRDGTIHRGYTPFGSAVYCMHQSADGTLWLGTKPDGLFRLRGRAGGSFDVEHIDGLAAGNVYHLTADGLGRLWAATLDAGLCVCNKPGARRPQFVTPRNYPTAAGGHLRYLCLTDGGRVLAAAATDGLVVARLEDDADRMVFRVHRRESYRPASLSGSAVMDIAKGADGSIFVSTESRGVNRVIGRQLTADSLSFAHYTVQNRRLADDVIMSLSPYDARRMLVTGSRTISLVDTAGMERTFDARHLNADYRFSEAHPQRIDADRWLFGLADGACIVSLPQMFSRHHRPDVVLTGVSVQGGATDMAVAHADTIVLQPHERNIIVRFAAIDYTFPERIRYAFRLLTDGGQWNYTGHDRSATLLGLKPGRYTLEIRSTDADGMWTDNTRRLTIVVSPTFWESAAGRLLLLLLAVGTCAAITYTLLYIRRIKRQQHETLEAYLALMEQNRNSHRPAVGTERKVVADDPVLERVMAFIDRNIGNSDINIGDMAAAAATSRSGLQRKLKQAMGVTPQDLMREARIKHACRQLRETDKTIAEVAYACGFTDPKYFSRCFRQSVGISPTEYKNTPPE